MDRSNRVDVVYGVYDNPWVAVKIMIKLLASTFRIGTGMMSVKDTIKYCSQYGYSIQRLGKGQWALYGTHDKAVFDEYICRKVAQE